MSSANDKTPSPPKNKPDDDEHKNPSPPKNAPDNDAPKKPTLRKMTPAEEHEKFIDDSIRFIHTNVEVCMTRYMKKEEAMDFLSRVKNIRPELTEHVWQQLEKENAEFFRYYYLQLRLKDQIEEFNRLLLMQAEAMESSGSVSPEDASHASSNSPIHSASSSEPSSPDISSSGANF